MSKVKNSKFDIALSNFLTHMLENCDNYAERLNSYYLKTQRKHFVYNCAMNTVYEYYEERRLYLDTRILTRMSN